MTKQKILASAGLVLGLAALCSMLVYGISGQFWWVETTRQDTERAIILTFMHIFPMVGGIGSAAFLLATWLNDE